MYVYLASRTTQCNQPRLWILTAATAILAISAAASVVDAAITVILAFLPSVGRSNGPAPIPVTLGLATLPEAVPSLAAADSFFVVASLGGHWLQSIDNV
jgi:hypothetical protein